MKNYDVIVIGAGHNALVTAAYLARAGKSVIVLERRDVIGGICVTEPLFPGHNGDPIVAGGSLRADVSRQLELTRFGYPSQILKNKLVSILPGDRRLKFSENIAETAASISLFSERDAGKWPEFSDFMQKASNFLESAYQVPMPRLPRPSPIEGLPLARLALQLRGLGGRDMYGVIRMLPMTVREFLDEWFESDVVKAAIATLGIHNANLGVMSAGSAFNLLHQYLLRGGWGQPRIAQGAGQISAAVAGAARDRGVEIRTGAEVESILVTENRVTGVQLTSGDQILSQCIVCGIDPRRTFTQLVSPEFLDPEFVHSIQHIKMRGVTARLHFLLDQQPVSETETIVLAPSLNYLERAYDAAKYGQISEHPYLEVTAQNQVLSIHMQFAPYHLRGAAWDAAARQKLESLVLACLEEQMPGLNLKIKDKITITPLDLEKIYALTEGDLNHGQLMLDQFLFMRPLPGWSNHLTPLNGLYLCGSGLHGGGGISGIPGRNAARQILKTGW